MKPNDLASLAEALFEFILISRLFLHFSLNETLGSLTPVWTDRLVKYALSAVLFTVIALDMLPKNMEKPFRAVQCLEIPEASFIPASSHNLSVRRTGISGFVFLKRIYVFIDTPFESLQVLPVFDIINGPAGQPMNGGLQFDWENGCKFKINNTCNMPFLVDEDIARLKVRQRESERTVAVLTRGELREQSTHHSQCSQLFLAIFSVMDGIWLMVDAIVMAL
jgi:hypothetical protein